MPDLIAGLKDLGRKPGEDIVIECPLTGKRYEGLAPAMSDLVKLPVDVLVSESEPAGHIARSVPQTVPNVTILSGDPVGSGLAQSLAKPGGNLTGLTYYATELDGKRSELLKDMIPGISSVGVLANPDVSYLPFETDTRNAAKLLGIMLVVRQVQEPSALDGAIHQMKAEGAQAFFVLPDVMFASEAKHVADGALAEQLPLMSCGAWFTELGGLIAYPADYASLIRRLALYVDRILKGAHPGDIPIEKVTRFELSLNLRMARTIGVTSPPKLLMRTDKVIE
ncbi:ABC transporter substrate-binding protein [Microvirga guangxiensis]|uniref:Putative ABC transport system substrate-binding protein n=1 Tax=Microvirga guangxiensis TaxID=549386 RepID=A0A1G5L1X1_9HYPH|nr:ABC transporter substrate-binding protein [Microvirga guangxiensis]SCZ06290.1 putative ABC transport system substrate-binding protein [Microvirga guangxiensis]